jgi:FkbM family methyltransferase
MPSTRLQKYTIYFDNSEEYHNLKREVFTSDLYYFETDNPTPFIIDVGAHIGLSTLYFKQLFPGSDIISIEPNPRSFELLEKNIFENQLDGITTINAAISDNSGPAKFYLDETDEKWHSTASLHKGSWAGTQDSKEITVQTHTLSEFITKPVDFLKLDIEGFEQAVLFQAKDSLPLIKEMQIEYHSHPTQDLQRLIDLLEKTHNLEVFDGTTIIPAKRIKKVTGLAQIRAVLK